MQTLLTMHIWKSNSSIKKMYLKLWKTDLLNWEHNLIKLRICNGSGSWDKFCLQFISYVNHRSAVQVWSNHRIHVKVKSICIIIGSIFPFCSHHSLEHSNTFRNHKAYDITKERNTDISSISPYWSNIKEKCYSVEQCHSLLIFFSKLQFSRKVTV